jgi:hypothetical protein
VVEVMGVNVEALARRLARRPAAVQELRDALVLWFVDRAQPQIARGMQYTDPDASLAEIRRVARLRAGSFFRGLVSSFEDPTRADLRRVKKRMDAWLRPERRRPDQEGLWEEILGGLPCSMIFVPT